MKKLNQQGTGIVEVLLILLVVLILGGVGWYVWQAKTKTNKTLTDTAQGAGEATKGSPKKKAAEKPAPDPTADWVAYSNKPGSYSFKHPKAWVQATHPELCTPEIALFGVNATSVGKCGSDSGGQMSFSSMTGDMRKDVELAKASYPDLVTEAVTINGVTGKKQTGTYKLTGEPAIGPVDGTKFVTYTFFTSGKTYVVTYSAGNPASPYTDALSDFNTLVTKTFKFTL